MAQAVAGPSQDIQAIAGQSVDGVISPTAAKRLCGISHDARSDENDRVLMECEDDEDDESVEYDEEYDEEEYGNEEEDNWEEEVQPRLSYPPRDPWNAGNVLPPMAVQPQHPSSIGRSS